jgi:hypothetical protein
LICLLVATTSCSPPDPEGYAAAKQHFAQNRRTYEELLKALTHCEFQMKKGKELVYATILSDPLISDEFGTCGGDLARTSAISALLRKAGAKYLEWSPTDGIVDFYYSDEHAPGTKTRTRLAIAYYAHEADESQRSADYDDVAPACVERVRALTDHGPYHWFWVSRFTTADTNIADDEECWDLRLS